MNWFDWTLIGFMVLSVVANILLVGKPREPITPGVALASLILNSALILGVVYL